MRRGSLDIYGSPPFCGYFPHDLDDIYEYKTDHQYFSHTNGSNSINIDSNNCTPFIHSKSVDHNNKTSIHNDHQRNNCFHRTPAAASLDDYTFPYPINSNNDEQQQQQQTRLQRQRFDNSSFIRSLNNDASDNSICQSPKEKSSKTSIHGMIKTLGKKAHIWPRKRHESTCSMIGDNNESGSSNNAINDPQENFRSRSKSLDVNYTNNILNDCDATYKIYDKIVREGKFYLFFFK